MNRSGSFLRLGLTCVTLACAGLPSGCRPGAGHGLSGPLELPVERERMYFSHDRSQGSEQDEAIRLVKEKAHDGTAQSTAEWITQQVEEQSEQVMFPRWRAVVVAPRKYEVTFTFTALTERGDIQSKGYLWRVDTLLDLVGAMEEMTPEEIRARQPGQRMMEKGQEDFGLE